MPPAHNYARMALICILHEFALGHTTHFAPPQRSGERKKHIPLSELTEDANVRKARVVRELGVCAFSLDPLSLFAKI